MPVTKANKKGPRATVCENLQANSSNTGLYFTYTFSVYINYSMIMFEGNL